MTNEIFIHARFSPPIDVGLDFSKSPSLTKQSFKDEVDINNIVQTYVNTGVLPPSSQNLHFGDFTQIEDFHSAQTALVHACQSFDLLPSNIRKRFNNDASELLDFLHDENNRDEAIQLGLVVDNRPDQVELAQSVQAEKPAVGET